MHNSQAKVEEDIKKHKKLCQEETGFRLKLEEEAQGYEETIRQTKQDMTYTKKQIKVVRGQIGKVEAARTKLAKKRTNFICHYVAVETARTK